MPPLGPSGDFSNATIGDYSDDANTGHNALLFSEWAAQCGQQCTDPACYQTKIDAHVRQTVAAKPKLVQISTAYGKPADGSPVVPRNQYVEIRQDKPKGKNGRDWPEYKTCKHTTEAIVADGTEKGELRKVCANPDCPVHHPKKQQRRANIDAAMKAAQEKQRRDEAQAQATGLRVLKAIGDAVPVRLMKRDLLFVVSRLSAMLDERKLAVLIRQHGMGKPKDGEAPAKLLAAFLPKAEESKLGRILVETAILLSMHNQADTAKILRDAAHVYKVDVDTSPHRSSRSSRRRRRRSPPRSLRPNRSRNPARKRLHNRQSIAAIRGASKNGSAFSFPVRVCPPSLDARERGRPHWPARRAHAAKPSANVGYRSYLMDKTRRSSGRHSELRRKEKRTQIEARLDGPRPAARWRS
jgi:hypothetical protein